MVGAYIIITIYATDIRLIVVTDMHNLLNIYNDIHTELVNVIIFHIGTSTLAGLYVFSKNVLKGKPKYYEVIRLKDQKNVFFQHIHSNPILINLTFLDNNE